MMKGQLNLLAAVVLLAIVAATLSTCGQSITNVPTEVTPTNEHVLVNANVTDVPTREALANEYALDTADVNDINVTGQVVGVVNDRGYQAFLWENGELTWLGTLGGDESEVFDINDRGQMVGRAETADGWAHAFLYDQGVITDLGIPGYTSMASRINERGQIEGTYANYGAFRAFFWENGVFTDLGMLSDTAQAIWPADLNNQGQIVGSGRIERDQGARPFLWENGQLTALADSGSAHDINDKGQIVGDIHLEDGVTQAVLWEQGAIKDLGVEP